MNNRSTLRRISTTLSNMAPYIFTKDNAYRFCSAIALTTIGMGLDLLVPWAFGETFALLTTGAASTTVLGLRLGPYAMTGASIGAYMVRDVLVSYRNEILTPVGPDAVKNFCIHYQAHSMERSLEQQRSAKTEDDIVRIQKAFPAMFSITNQLFTTIVPVSLGTIFTSAVIGWKFGAQVGVSLGGIVVLSTAYNVSTAEKNIELRNASLLSGNKGFDSLLKGLEHTETIQRNTSQHFEKKQCKEANQKWADAETASNAFSHQVTRRQGLITNLGFAGLGFLTVQGILAQRIPPQDFGALCTLLIQFFGPVNAFGSATSQIVSGVADLESAFDHLAIKPKIKDHFPEKELKIETKSAAIELRNISLSYGEKQILRDVSCIIPPGKKTVIVGESGSGKSTILNLIDRTLDPDKGVVLINGQDIKNVGLQSLRSNVSTIQQKSDLFHESIASNIKYGRQASTDQEMIDSAQKACLAEFIEAHPDKYKMDVGEKGGKLSGGQAQRVAIARALIRKPKILLCDEATSALDNATEAKIQRLIDKTPDATIVMVTHDLSAAVNADKIIVLEKGRIVEEGIHEELLKKDGVYAKLWKIQNPTPEVSDDKSIRPNSYNPKLFVSAATEKRTEKSKAASIEITTVTSTAAAIPKVVTPPREVQIEISAKSENNSDEENKPRQSYCSRANCSIM